MSRQRTPTLEIRDALLRAARQLLDEGGPEALAVRDIAARAGVSPMGVYNRFGSKDGVIDALIQQGFTELGVAVSVTPSEPLPALAAGMAAYRGFALTNPSMYRLMFDASPAGYVPSDIARSTARATYKRLVDGVRLGIAAGHIERGDPVEIAQRLWAAGHGAVSLELRGICFAPDRDAHYTALMQTLLRGLATEGQHLNPSQPLDADQPVNPGQLA